ncbi:CapA family protein [Halobacillus salinarum]|uniref:CapA family protein n=1 Tax=Halobacillus salinarum TaxID=2932257 RepID=A0ABY4ELR6_9BACI|nr:CapA family protein [Halobacillus salinarum]UOQ45073.1 CapA family protein [Halobacillus salinarum]
MRLLLAIANLVLICMLITACAEKPLNTIDSKNMPNLTNTSLHKDAPANIRDPLTISAIGDILIHKRVYTNAKTKSGYDFLPMLDQVKPYLTKSDITIANEETMIGGKELGLSGYPSFNSPKEVGEALKASGVDIVSIANNHSLDKGETGIRHAIKNWEDLGMMYTGAYKSRKDQQQIRVYKTPAQPSVAFLSYTYGTNGIKTPAGKSYLVNRINYSVIKSDINRAKKRADAIVISFHFGKQYHPLPTQEQKKLSQFAADQGVDVVIGHHPHVLQPLEWLTGKNGNKTLVAYSLGNFFSGQDAFQKRIGGMLTFDLVTTSNKKDPIQAEDPRFLITFVSSEGAYKYEVVPMASLKKYSGDYEETKKHLSQWMPELSFIN